MGGPLERGGAFNPVPFQPARATHKRPFAGRNPERGGIRGCGKNGFHPHTSVISSWDLTVQQAAEGTVRNKTEGQTERKYEKKTALNKNPAFYKSRLTASAEG